MLCCSVRYAEFVTGDHTALRVAPAQGGTPTVLLSVHCLPVVLCCAALLQVIILPIAWHQRKEESQRILDASEKAQQLLTAAGLTCRIDDGDKFTPGQKMKYW